MPRLTSKIVPFTETSAIRRRDFQPPSALLRRLHHHRPALEMNRLAAPSLRDRRSLRSAIFDHRSIAQSNHRARILWRCGFLRSPRSAPDGQQRRIRLADTRYSSPSTDATVARGPEAPAVRSRIGGSVNPQRPPTRPPQSPRATRHPPRTASRASSPLRLRSP